MNRVLVVAVLSTSLTGCGLFQRFCPKPVPPAIPDGTASVNIDVELLKQCEALPALTGNTESDAAALAKSWSELYATCAVRHKKLVEVTSKAWNIKQDPPH